MLESYADDPRPDDTRRAVQHALDATSAILDAAEPHVVRYCEEMPERYEDDECPAVTLEKQSDVWSHVQFGSVFYVSPRADGDAEDRMRMSSCRRQTALGMLRIDTRAACSYPGAPYPQ